MKFDVYIEDEPYTIEVNPADVQAGKPMFDSMDKDMDGGWRMGPEYIHEPDIMQRTQIVAERLMLAMESRNAPLITAMAAYIVYRVPNIRELHIDTSGDPLLTEIVT